MGAVYIENILFITIGCQPAEVARSSDRIIIDVLKDRAELDRVATSNADRWAEQELLLYIAKNYARFEPINKLMLCADPSTHAGQETLFGVVYSWQLELAQYGLPQIIPAAKHLSVDDKAFEMSDAIKVASNLIITAQVPVTSHNG